MSKKDTLSDFAVQYQQLMPGIGRFSMRPLLQPEDMPLIHQWVTQPYAHYWGMEDYSVEQLTEEYQNICQTADVFIGTLNGEPVFLMERYHPADDQVAEHYAVAVGDRGMHILVAPVDKPISGFTWAVFRVVMDFLFSDPTVERVVVEPDIRNKKIHALNARAGFEFQKPIELSNKTARLEFCTRTQYRAALLKDKQQMKTRISHSPALAVGHLSPEVWAQVNRLHLCKMLSEFAHEVLIEPELVEQDGEWGEYLLKADQASIEYRFRAQRMSLDHWHIDTESIEKTGDGQAAMLDSQAFIVEFAARLGMDDTMLPTYLEEVASTLYGSAYKHTNAVSVDDLVHADFQQIEAAMIEGHPTFVANNGRIGFDAADFHNFAPEAAAPVNLIWLAIHKTQAVFACIHELSYDSLLQQELGDETLQLFSDQLAQQELAADDYLFMPIHPWQWYNKLAMVFAADIAQRKIVFLGESGDDYQAQQSIRTFFNTSAPGKYYVKTALSILNMGFMRGLSPCYMSSTPAINDWIHYLVDHDRYLASKGFRILREVAAIGYRNHHFDNDVVPDSPYKKMLSSLWRESPVIQIKPNQHLMTMAALLHVDGEGRALLPELIQASGISTSAWLARYLDCYLSPLLHCFYAHDLVFMPHGENLILVFEGHVPVRAFMKDIGEESVILNPDVVLSEKVQRLAVQVPEALKVLYLLTDVFESFFRYLSQILHVQHGYPETRFWQQVAHCVEDYQRAHPEYREKFERYDLFTPEFARCCLNRLQLANNRQMIDLGDPTKKLQFVGTLQNPMAAYRPVERVTPEPALKSVVDAADV